MIQAGEVLRRNAFWTLDALHGGKQRKIKKINKREIIHGITLEYEKRRLATLLNYARKYVPYYQKLSEASSLEDFPVMSKMDYNAHMEELFADSYRDHREELSCLSTSGSTGTPFKVFCDREKMARYNMNFISVMELNGFRFGMKRAEFRVWIKGKNVRSPFTCFKTNLQMYDISNMGDEALANISQRIRKERIQVLVIYSSALTALVDYIKRTGEDVHKWSVEMVFTMGEALPRATYDGVKAVFGFAPVRSYGNNENGFIAVQLHEDERYTVDLYNFYIEILKLNSDEPAAPGELGRIVVTDYYNRAFPMIRYDTGDTGIYEEVCDVRGRKHGYFTEIYGRRGSLLYNCKGEPLSIHVFMNVLLNLEGVVHQAKCIQWEKTRYELLLNADRDKVDEASVVASYRTYLGEEAQISVTYVDEIPVLASGKHMVCENRCPDYQ